VAGIIDDGPVEIASVVAEGFELGCELRQREIVLLDHLEAETAEGSGNRAGVAVGILERLHIAIGPVADHQSDALLGRPRQRGCRW
jgi:hypothetical protein